MDALKDTMDTCLSIISNGKVYGDIYPGLVDGISLIKQHIFGGYAIPKFINGASKVLCLASCIYTETRFERFYKFGKYKNFIGMSGDFDKPHRLRWIDPKVYDYVVASNKLIGNLFGARR